MLICSLTLGQEYVQEIKRLDIYWVKMDNLDKDFIAFVLGTIYYAKSGRITKNTRDKKIYAFINFNLFGCDDILFN